MRERALFIERISILGIYRFSRNTQKYGILGPDPEPPEMGLFPGKRGEKARDFPESGKSVFSPGTALVCNPLVFGDFRVS